MKQAREIIAVFTCLFLGATCLACIKENSAAGAVGTLLLLAILAWNAFGARESEERDE